VTSLIYIARESYIERERERKKERVRKRAWFMVETAVTLVYMYMYMYCHLSKPYHCVCTGADIYTIIHKSIDGAVS
jgi:hypothetical protein